jgi:hypothetical protein
VTRLATIQVLVIDHKQGVAVTVHPTVADADDAIDAWVDQWWDSEVPAGVDRPDDREAAADLFWVHAQEHATITEAVIDLDALHLPAAA